MGTTDQKNKLNAAKLGIAVQNHYDYDADITQELEQIANETAEMWTKLIDTEKLSSPEQFLSDGRRAIVEHFQGCRR